MKATQLLRAAEEEFWHNQHPQPYIFPESPGGTSYERYECYKVGGIVGRLGLFLPSRTPGRNHLPCGRGEASFPLTALNTFLRVSVSALPGDI